MHINILGEDINGVQFGAYDDDSGFCLVHPDGRQERADGMGRGIDGYIFNSFISSHHLPNDTMPGQVRLNNSSRVSDRFGIANGPTRHHNTNRKQASKYKDMRVNETIATIERHLMSFKHNTRDDRTITELLKELEIIVASKLKRHEEISKKLEEKRKAILDGLIIGKKYVVDYNNSSSEICTLEEDGDLSPMTFGYEDIVNVFELTPVNAN
jgi:hypothetical protein